MSIAGIEKVRDAEALAEQVRKSSLEEAAQIVAAGKKEANALLEEAERNGTAVYKSAIASAEVEAEKLYQMRIHEEQEACNQFKSAARENLKEAVDAIVGKVVGTYGNS